MTNKKEEIKISDLIGYNKMSIEEKVAVNRWVGDYLLENKRETGKKYFGKSLYACYDRPSQTKVIIYEALLALNTYCGAGYDGGVISYNTNMFTYGFEAVHPVNGKRIYIYITKCHNYFWYL